MIKLFNATSQKSQGKPSTRKAKNVKKVLIAATMLASLTACTPKLVEKLPYYKLPVIQGVPLEPKSVLAIQAGMTREQVQLYIGAPLLRPSFRDTQWDYNYEVLRGGKVKESRNLTVYFQGNVVSRVEGSALDYAREQIAQQNQPQQEKKSWFKFNK
ncbi:outer membrane protein assembly factor BamE [Alysiella filiformis]|uniref:outer membrane protein assembly factor BamE n=1 Tax=Alysiella filiformis TaxID=194196 RepID=UPI0027BAB1C9|nr:outer membrane protein assembly factor BamE [Alysiella filiformis]